MYSPLSKSMVKLYALAMFFFTANSVLTVVVPLQAADHGYREGEIGIMMGFYMFACMLLRPWAGQMIAKHSVLTVMRWLLIGHALTLLVYICFGADGLYIVRALQGAVTAFFSMAMQIGIGNILRDEDRGQGMSMYSLSTVLPGLYGPALALLLWTPSKLAYLSVFIAVLAIVPLLFLLRSPLPGTKQGGAAFTLREMRSALAEVLPHNGLIVSAFVMLAGAFVFGAVSTFLPLYMVTTGEGNPALYLFLQAVVVVCSRFVLRKYIPSDGNWHPVFVSVVLLFSVAGTALLAVLPHLGYFVYLSSVFNGLAMSLLYPTITTYISFAVPKATKHILFGIFLASYDLGFALGGFATGYIVQLFSFAHMFAACSLIALSAIGFIWIKRRETVVILDVQTNMK
ncbi:staphylopine family metallophore export MFS transporter CntE [Paenibacillus alkalitolerans]|uniref:staphylopine family metallophore export MFS transporter CntE n=1 Tax=Paenibacillus alkalitolerans TaxID=2799335 RepID=UPI001F37E92B|nr:MFS transporter [Paenibacillus alkalitolerans]